MGCKCRNSRCLKRYCVCFNAAKSCNNACQCSECGNLERHQEPSKHAKKLELCRCRRSRCLKRYCECFAVARRCCDKCKCTDCGNRPEDDEVAQIFQGEPAHTLALRVNSPPSVIDDFECPYGTIGVCLEETRPGTVTVVGVAPNSLAATHGLKPGTRLLEINKVRVHHMSFSDCIQACTQRPALLKFAAPS